MSDNLCLDCAHKDKPSFEGVSPERRRKDVQCNKEALSKQNEKWDRTFGNLDGENQVLTENVNIAGW
jgi:hypothetical protein